jgi:hypothetical protein
MVAALVLSLFADAGIKYVLFLLTGASFSPRIKYFV